MSQIALTGSDVIQINGRVLTAFGDGDVGVLTYPNEIAAVKRGKDGNTVYAQNAMGLVSELVLRLIRATPDDVFLLTLMTAQNAAFAAFSLMDGQIVKVIGDGSGDISNDTYVMSGGIFTKPVGVKSNVEGDTEQALSIYNFKFSSPGTLGRAIM